MVAHASVSDACGVRHCGGSTTGIKYSAPMNATPAAPAPCIRVCAQFNMKANVGL